MNASFLANSFLAASFSSINISRSRAIEADDSLTGVSGLDAVVGTEIGIRRFGVLGKVICRLRLLNGLKVEGVLEIVDLVS